MLALSGPGVSEEDRIVVALHHDFIFEPGAGRERGAGRVVLHGGLICVQVPDAVAGLNFVNRSGAVFEQAIRFGSNAVEILR